MGLSKAHIPHLLRLGRMDGPLLATLLVPAGFFMSGGSPQHISETIEPAIVLGLLAMHFVYALNGLTDVEEDRINKPHRAIPSGALPLSIARWWVAGLFVASLGATWALLGAWALRLPVFGVLLLGLLYSVPPARLKRFPPLATLTIALLLHLALIEGIELASGEWPSWLGATMAFCAFALPLKDIEDTAGDLAAGLGSWTRWLSPPQLLVGAMLGWTVSWACCALLFEGHIRLLLSALFAGSIVCVASTLALSRESAAYTWIVRWVLLCAVGAVISGLHTTGSLSFAALFSP